MHTSVQRGKRTGARWRAAFKRDWPLYLIFSVPLTYIAIFKLYPLLGIQIAFKDFVASKGIWGSPWAGFKHFERFLSSYEFGNILWNTLRLSFYSLIAGFPVPILLAVCLNQLRNGPLKKTVQMVTYAPHFISTVVMVAMLLKFLAPRNGMFNQIGALFGATDVNFIGVPAYFSHIYVWSGVWQEMGYSSIVFLAALSAIDPQLHEAAIVDGASRLKRIWHLDLPGIVPTIVTLLILRMGMVLLVGFEKVFLMQNQMNRSASEVISTYVYKISLASKVPNFSYATAVGVFVSAVNMIMILVVNAVSRKVTETSLW